ncbi:MAG: methionine synthase [Bacteroidales bacterium]|nr:methionine synthase [Bacteroidales bacterium]MDD3961526.1 methionine synthase [Bacteroidales bacterium]
MTFEDYLKYHIAVLDGATGTQLQKFNLTEADFRGVEFSSHPVSVMGCNDLLCLTKPEVVARVHRDYLLAGANLIETNTFNANRISMEDYQLENDCYRINRAAAEIAVAEAKLFKTNNTTCHVWVVGSMGPTNRSASISPEIENPGARNITFDHLTAAYSEQAEGLMDGGVDVLLVETVFDTLNCKAALFAIASLFEQRRKRIPVMVSVTLSDASGRTLSGQALDAFVISILHAKPISIGLNCSLGPEQLRPYVAHLSTINPCYLSVHPNAGLPDELGNYNQSAETMGAFAREFAEKGWINIMGGCCGTGPEHIRAIAAQVAQFEPRKRPEIQNETKLSGLDPCVINQQNNFVNIGERTNVSGSRKFANLITHNKYSEALAIARNQVENGAQVIDICMDDALINAREAMVTFLNLIASDPDVARFPVMIDSSSWEVILDGLKCCQGKCVVNSISLKEGEEPFLKKANLLKKMGAAMVVMLFDEKGQAVDYQRRIEIAERSFRLLTQKEGVNPTDIIFDPNVLAVATGIQEHDAYALDFFRAVRWIKENLPGVKTSGGVSNLSFAFRGNNRVREAMHAVFLYHAIQSGLDMAIVNPAMHLMINDIDPDLKEAVEQVILNLNPEATARLTQLASNVDTTPLQQQQSLQWREMPLPDRIEYAVLHGLSDFVVPDMNEALNAYPQAFTIIDEPLMNAMSEVGRRFSAGEMFLPQVVKSARAMRLMVNHIRPEIERQSLASEHQRKVGKILLATVRGDVHDIGKNILSVILSCNRFEIIDLGVMVPAEKIVQKAIEYKVDMIALSGLITPSLAEMIEVARRMQDAALSVPLMVGGATTSALHTAVKIAPSYTGLIVHAKDASEAATLAYSLLVEKDNQQRVQKIKAAQQGLLSSYKQKLSPLVSLQEARKQRFVISSTYIPPIPYTFDLQYIKRNAVELLPWINWRMFFAAWKVKSNASLKLKNEAIAFITSHLSLFRIDALCRIFPAAASNETIFLSSPDGQGVLGKLEFPRQLKMPFLSLADYVLPSDDIRKDFLGLFASSVHLMQRIDDEYLQLMADLLADRLVEAMAEYLHFVCRTEWWRFSKEEELPVECLKGHYQGIRPAPGYPAWPDHSQKKILLEMLEADQRINLTLTPQYSMIPKASVCGVILSYPGAAYFDARAKGED